MSLPNLDTYTRLISLKVQNHYNFSPQKILNTECFMDLDKLSLDKLRYGGLVVGSIQFSLLLL